MNIDTKGSTQPIKNQTQNRRPRLLAKNPEIKGGVSTMVEISKSIISGMVIIKLWEEAAKIGIWRDVLELIDYQLFRSTGCANLLMCWCANACTERSRTGADLKIRKFGNLMIKISTKKLILNS
ncbi:MAG: hypothetical protein IPN54_14255 [Bacteroidetes bacterium]|nr:hypothetical protein [Bacteroidota bacterium]